MQDCPLSPYLLNLFVEEIIDEYEKNSKGISVKGE